MMFQNRPGSSSHESGRSTQVVVVDTLLGQYLYFLLAAIVPAGRAVHGDNREPPADIADLMGVEADALHRERIKRQARDRVSETASKRAFRSRGRPRALPFRWAIHRSRASFSNSGD